MRMLLCSGRTENSFGISGTGPNKESQAPPSAALALQVAQAKSAPGASALLWPVHDLGVYGGVDEDCPMEYGVHLPGGPGHPNHGPPGSGAGC
jgi:hypothetical protein